MQKGAHAPRERRVSAFPVIHCCTSYEFPGYPRHGSARETATPAMALRMERAETLSEELFILQTLGDDRAIAQTYVAGPMQGR